MKLEEVLAHLKAGGKVKLKSHRIDIDNDYIGYLTSEVLLSDEFEIVKGPYRLDTMIHVSPEYYGCYRMEDKLLNLKDLFPKIATKEVGKYKVTIEEIEE